MHKIWIQDFVQDLILAYIKQTTTYQVGVQ